MTGRYLVAGKWIGIVEYEESASPGNMVCFTEIIVATIKKIGGVRIVVSRGAWKGKSSLSPT